MIKVFEDFDIMLVGHYQSVLESNDIATFHEKSVWDIRCGGVAVC